MSSLIFIQWLTIAAYLGIAWLCGVGARNISKTRPNSPKAHKNLWLGLSFLFILLAVNKQFKFLSWITEKGRQMAWQQEWYIVRESVQIPFMLSVLGLILITLLLISIRFRHNIRQYGLLLLSSFFLLGFVVIRAISIHAVDWVLYHPIAGFQINWVIELGGILLVASAVIILFRQWQTQTYYQREVI